MSYAYAMDSLSRILDKIAELADPPDGFKDLTLEDAKKRLQKILELAEGEDE